MSKNIYIIVLSVTIFIAILTFLAVALPIFDLKEKVLSVFTSIDANPYNFPSGINIDSSKPYKVNVCFNKNITQFFFNPRAVVTHSTYETSPNIFNTELNIVEYDRSFPYISLVPKRLTTVYNFEDFLTSEKKSSEYCGIDFSDENRRIFSYDQLLQLKQDAINNPKQKTPDILTEEEIRKELERQIKEEESSQGVQQ